MIARSNFVGEDGNVMPQLGGNDVTHQTSHPDRWGGWFVTSDGAPAPYAQRAHEGNITFSGRGDTSNQVFVDWLNSAPETRGYLSSLSDIVALLVFDHQMHAINLLTRLNWESRIASSNGHASVSDGTLRRLVNELADYLLFVGEAPPSVPLTPPQRFAERLESKTPKDRHGRSFGQLDLVNRFPYQIVAGPRGRGSSTATRPPRYRPARSGARTTSRRRMAPSCTPTCCGPPTFRTARGHR